MGDPIQPLVLYPSKGKFATGALLALLFCIASVWMITRGESIGWAGLIFFGFGLLVLLIAMIPGASSLTLTAEGFQTVALFRKRFTRWDEVTNFEIAEIGNREMVVFNYTAAHTQLQGLKRFSQTMTDWQGSMGNDYGMTNEGLAKLMNEWRFLNAVGRQS